MRPTISPAMKTAMIAITSMPYRPEPTPPGAISPSIMPSSVRPPPKPVYEEWKESTAPVDVSVVATAKIDEPPTPNRCSLPSIAPPAACRAGPPWWNSVHIISAVKPIQISPMVARIA